MLQQDEIDNADDELMPQQNGHGKNSDSEEHVALCSSKMKDADTEQNADDETANEKLKILDHYATLPQDSTNNDNDDLAKNSALSSNENFENKAVDDANDKLALLDEQKQLEEDIEKDLRQELQQDLQKDQTDKLSDKEQDIQKDLEQDPQQDFQKNQREILSANEQVIQTDSHENQMPSDKKQDVEKDLQHDMQLDLQQNLRETASVKKEDIGMDLEEELPPNLPQNQRKIPHVKKEDIRMDLEEKLQQDLQQDLQQNQRETPNANEQAIEKDSQQDTQLDLQQQQREMPIAQDAQQILQQELQQDSKETPSANEQETTTNLFQKRKVSAVSDTTTTSSKRIKNDETFNATEERKSIIEIRLSNKINTHDAENEPQTEHKRKSKEHNIIDLEKLHGGILTNTTAVKAPDEKAKVNDELKPDLQPQAAAEVITNSASLNDTVPLAKVVTATVSNEAPNEATTDTIVTPVDDMHVEPTLPERAWAKLTEEERLLDDEFRLSCQAFLQHVPCFKLQLNKADDSQQQHVVPRCRECRRKDAPNNHAAEADTEAQIAAANDIYCRFYEFRRLQYDANGELRVAGFPNPYQDPKQEDINIWQPDAQTEPTAGYMDVQVCRYILLHVGDQFCYLWRQEVEALALHENPDSTIAWKKMVPDLREICDVCDTTLFNYHWTCNKCGFGVCIDCFKDRKEQRKRHKLATASSHKSQRGRDEFHWMYCTGVEKHVLAELMLTQIISGDSLNVLGHLLHQIRVVWQIPQKCDCLDSHQPLPAEYSKLTEIVEDMIKDSRLNQHTAASSLATKETLRYQRRMEKLHSHKVKFAREFGQDYVPGRILTKETLGKDPVKTAFDSFEHINVLRMGMAGYRRFLPPKVMFMFTSSKLASTVPHEWLCDGKLLRLTDPMHQDNRILFQEVWKCGQPVMVSEVARSLNLDLWRPEAFCRDFGDKPNDLINCLNGNLVPNQPMRHFWEGFQCIKKRLCDASGKPMLLKLKDWPPGDDFAEILPTRFSDLMKGLPLPEYTLRTGNLNIASCLPKMFVPPDLGPKMYNAYGSALHPDKGTTNLHLDISDAVNVMVYVGIPEDAESKPQLHAGQNAIAMGGCDFLTRLRCQSSKVLPGALWHIFAARDADKIRDLLNRVTLEKGFRLEPDHDPIHDQNWYLDDELRARLFREYGVTAYPIVQCLGDAVFIPAGAPHQVQNLHNCIKVAEDFVSPENITHCYHLTHEFRQLSHSHTNHEDKLQIKNIIYHAVKDCCMILTRALDKRLDAEVAAAKKARKLRKKELKREREREKKGETDMMETSVEMT